MENRYNSNSYGSYISLVLELLNSVTLSGKKL